MVICLERGADLHIAQLMPLPLTVSCSSKIQIGFTFLVQVTWVVLEKGSLNECVCVFSDIRAIGVTYTEHQRPMPVGHRYGLLRLFVTLHVAYSVSCYYVKLLPSVQSGLLTCRTLYQIAGLLVLQ